MTVKEPNEERKPRFRKRTLRRVFASNAFSHAVLANTGWLLSDRLLRILISVGVGAWVARHLGPSSYGKLAYALALLAVFQAACSLGLDGPVVREITEDPARSPEILGSALRLRLVAGVIGWLGTLLLAASWHSPGSSLVVMVGIVGASLVFQPADVVELWLQGQSKSRVSMPFRLLAYAIAALERVALILINAPLWLFAAAALSDAVLVACALAWAYVQHPTASAWRWNGAMAKKLLLESWPLMLSAISIGAYMRIDQVMLRELAGERQLGLYSAALPFSQVWHMLPMTLCASVLPYLTRLRAKDPSAYRLRLQQLFDLLAWTGVAAAGITALFAPLLVSALLGPQFSESVTVLRWHAVTNIFVFLGLAQGVSIVTEHVPHVALLKTLTGAVVSVVANWLLIPHWGALGSAWAAVIAYGCSAVLSNLLFDAAVFRMQVRAFFPFHEAHS